MHARMYIRTHYGMQYPRLLRTPFHSTSTVLPDMLKNKKHKKGSKKAEAEARNWGERKEAIDS